MSGARDCCLEPFAIGLSYVSPSLEGRGELARSQTALVPLPAGQGFPGHAVAGSSPLPPASFIIAFCNLSNARTSIWRTRSRDTP